MRVFSCLSHANKRISVSFPSLSHRKLFLFFPWKLPPPPPPQQLLAILSHMPKHNFDKKNTCFEKLFFVRQGKAEKQSKPALSREQKSNSNSYIAFTDLWSVAEQLKGVSFPHARASSVDQRHHWQISQPPPVGRWKRRSCEVGSTAYWWAQGAVLRSKKLRFHQESLQWDQGNACYGDVAWEERAQTPVQANCAAFQCLDALESAIQLSCNVSESTKTNIYLAQFNYVTPLVQKNHTKAVLWANISMFPVEPHCGILQNKS